MNVPSIRTECSIVSDLTVLIFLLFDALFFLRHPHCLMCLECHALILCVNDFPRISWHLGHPVVGNATFVWWRSELEHKTSNQCCSWIPWRLSFRYIHCIGQFTPKMKANAEPRLLSSLVWIDSSIVVSQHRLESFFNEIKC